MPKIKQAGFTLIEILIVIAIIAILVTLLLYALGDVQRNARDKQRQTEIASVASALQRYYSNNGRFPASLSGRISVESNCTTGGTDERVWGTEAFDCTPPSAALITYMRQLPASPTGTQYCYEATTPYQTFRLFAVMENASNGNLNPTQSCNSTSGYNYRISSRN